jgi:hypothetical protein
MKKRRARASMLCSVSSAWFLVLVPANFQNESASAAAAAFCSSKKGRGSGP